MQDIKEIIALLRGEGAVQALLVLIIVVLLFVFREVSVRNEKQNTVIKELSEKFIIVTEQSKNAIENNTRALNDHARMIDKLVNNDQNLINSLDRIFDKLDRKK